MGFKAKTLTLPFAWLILSACQLSAVLFVQQSDGRLTFSVDDGSGRERCIRSVYVYPDQPAGAEPLWHVEEVRRAACLLTIGYGRVPDGFVADGPAPKLQAGANYQVSVAGPGFNEEAAFVAK